MTVRSTAETVTSHGLLPKSFRLATLERYCVLQYLGFPSIHPRMMLIPNVAEYWGRHRPGHVSRSPVSFLRLSVCALAEPSRMKGGDRSYVLTQRHTGRTHARSDQCRATSRSLLHALDLRPMKAAAL
jgi:hypothetical protein